MKEQLTRQECIDRYCRLETTERMKVYDKAKSMMPEDPLDNFSVPLENIANVLDVDLLPEQPEQPDPITFTPGVPTEDGWYVVKVRYRNMEVYDTIHILNWDWDMDGEILSHAKLPEL